MEGLNCPCLYVKYKPTKETWACSICGNQFVRRDHAVTLCLERDTLEYRVAMLEQELREAFGWLVYPEKKPEKDGLYEVICTLPSGREERRFLNWSTGGWTINNANVRLFSKPRPLYYFKDEETYFEQYLKRKMQSNFRKDQIK